MTDVCFVHGIRTFSSDKYFKPLSESLQGATSHFMDYGYVLLPLTNKRAVRACVDVLAPLQDSSEEIIVVAYSNGAWAALQCAELGYRIDRLILISPALHINRAFPKEIKSIDVWYCLEDYATYFGKFWRMTTDILPWRTDNPHGFGMMGMIGSVQEDERITNIRMPDYVGHGYYKHPDVVRSIRNNIQQYTENT